MIQTSIQLKALIRNKSKGVSSKAQALIRCYMMERFLERLSCSQYRNFIIIKGGLLLTALISSPSPYPLLIHQSAYPSTESSA